MNHDLEDEMCPNCVTPWKCNGPHLIGEEMLRVTMRNEIEFFTDDSGYMFLKQEDDMIVLGKESVATLEKFVSELNGIKFYLMEE